MSAEQARASMAELEANKHRVDAAAVRCRLGGAVEVEVGHLGTAATPWREARWFFTATMADGTTETEADRETPWDAAEAVAERLAARGAPPSS